MPVVGIEDFEEAEDMLEPVWNQQGQISGLQEQLGYVTTENRNLANRMTQMEMVMNEMLTHLKQLNIKQEL